VDTLTKYTVAVEDKQYQIDITKIDTKEHFKVKIDEKPVEVKLADTKLEYDTPVQIKIGEKTHTVEISGEGRQAPYTVKIKDVPLKAEVKTLHPRIAIRSAEAPTPTLVTKKSPTGKTLIEGAITAPMAGRIVAIKVKKGDSVKAGAVVCILEAMKMENEIVTPRIGTVQEINVSEGVAVSEGDVLVIIK
jgi:biotin carboxyl carrier protein